MEIMFVSVYARANNRFSGWYFGDRPTCLNRLPSSRVVNNLGIYVTFKGLSDQRLSEITWILSTGTGWDRCGWKNCYADKHIWRGFLCDLRIGAIRNLGFVIDVNGLSYRRGFSLLSDCYASMLSFSVYCVFVILGFCRWFSFYCLLGSLPLKSHNLFMLLYITVSSSALSTVLNFSILEKRLQKILIICINFQSQRKSATTFSWSNSETLT